MAGFLSAYSGTRRVDLGGGYWVDVKKCLTIVEKQRAEQALASNPTVDMNGNGSATMDVVAFRNELVAASITAWNLDEEDGTVWALSPEPVKRTNIARLPGPVFDQIFTFVNELNGPQSSKERAQFPVADVGGDPDGNAGAAVAGDVLDGAAVVAASGAASGGPGASAVA